VLGRQEIVAMSRLTIDVTDQQHQSLKVMAALQGKTIKQYAIERLFPSASDEEAALQELKALLVQRLAQSTNDAVSTQSLTDIAEEVMRLDGSK
jgi:hypothetical protein